MKLVESDIDILKTAFNQALNERDSLDHETHRKHHDYIDTLIHESKVKSARHEAIRRQIMGWGIAVFLTGIGTALYNFFIKGNTGG